MHYIRLILISFTVLAVIITGFSLFIPSDVRISRATTINAGKDSVMAQLNNPVNWQKWYPQKDSATLLYIEGKVKGIADSSRGLMITLVTDSSVQAMNVGEGSKEGETGWNLMQGSAPGNVTVQWYMDFHLRWYPWEKFASLLLDQSYGPMMEEGLTSLKKQVEL